METEEPSSAPRHAWVHAWVRSVAPAVGLLVGLWAGAASAAEVWKSGDWSIDGSGFYKPYLSWLRFQDSLVEGTKDMAAALDEARALLPPETAAQLPALSGLPLQVGISSHTFRLGGKVSWTDALELEVAWQAAVILASAPAFAGAGGSSYLGATLVTPKRRLVDFEPFLLDAGSFRVQHNLDRLAVTWRGKHVTVVVGRQVLSWGTGRLWNPTDLISPFAPTDVDREVRRGADAVRASFSLGATSQLDVLWLPQKLARDMGGVVRARTNLWGWDFSATVGKYVRDIVVGADFSGDLGPLGAHGEAAWTLPLVRQGDFLRAVVGLEWRPLESLVVGAEYYFNGFGARTAAGLLGVLTSDRVVRGEIFGGGRHYAGVTAAWLATDLLTGSLTAIVNLVDPSALFVPSLEYSFEQHVLVRVGGFVPVGRGVDLALMRGLSGADVIADNAAWRRATTSFGAQSEYGLSGYGAFVQVGLYIP